MHTFPILASILALAASISAAAVPSHRYVQLRLWGQPHCDTLNLGESGIYGDQTAQCNELDPSNTVRSVNVERLDAGCVLYFYSDLECALGEHEITSSGCVSGDASYGSYKLFCDV
ncbi:hypothetical protein PDE_00667 [Penicillium oxalicum 114-2]|uniref:Cyanovirin-N domain-containing protein n=1 Tax=Penicillium oxalicum (strain 114-2 / CGMCC 5302) TaxID=933388 RepID=S7ZAL8_PENO1|nr:hypothetical protein PDE_00667 [Penicillium oxalicum 114-2]